TDETRKADRKAVGVFDRPLVSRRWRRRRCSGGVRIAVAKQRGFVGMDGLGTWDEAKALEIIGGAQKTRPGKQMNPRLLQRHEPGIGHWKRLGALAHMVKPVPL